MVPDEFGTSVQLLGRLFSSLASCTAAAWLVVCMFFFSFLHILPWQRVLLRC